MESLTSKYLTTPVGTIDPARKLVAEIRGAVAGFSLANGRIGDYSTTVLTSPIIEGRCSGLPTNKSTMVVISITGRRISPPCLTDKQRRHIASHSAQ
jgi:hypothetical protein